MSYLFHTIFFLPLYNAMVLMITALPWVDLGMIVILFTILVKLILFPLSQKASKTQILMRQVQPEVDRIKKEYPDKKDIQAKKMMEVYKKYDLNPLSGTLLILIQLPIIFALYFIFRGGFPNINTALLYPFVHTPEHISAFFLGLVDISKPNVVIAALAAVSQFIQAKFAMPKLAPALPEDDKKPSFKNDFAKSMQWQMLYVMPLFILLVASRLNAAIALYWITSNIFMTAQEIFIRKKLAVAGAK
jgi:YidC/Oxa1 family membrane protein insertase